ncbi:MAG: hypothetical protein K2J78_12420 [Muribaculaceae bacterium]|nr:hypothetical protein [Muribaculaceae bacterium]
MRDLIMMLLVVCFSLVGTAQQTHDLSPEEIEAFKVQCQERVDAFQMGLEIIADKQQDNEIKDHYIRTIPEMFMGKGDVWYDRNNTKHDAVKMQVSSVSTGNVNDVPLKEYLRRLRNLPYTRVSIQKAKTCLISNLYKVNDNLYMGTCSFFQYFSGENGSKEGGNVVYRDFTQKDVDVYITRVEDGSLGSYWDMKFGDINVTETKRLPNH